ncbi:hypothetical protein [Campylobacter concisus]|uniref:hypothetical protein n=1 Tax=Campylobacter concisus TaxID=199 RepID=UPI000925C39B|nr:hypothetical protein [Campylobacter concisus]OJJ27845.1 hypothetical protein TH67_08985 [Campylobacter concisus]
MQKQIKEWLVDKFSISLLALLLFQGCGYNIQIAPNVTKSAQDHKFIAKPENTKEYMIKYLPANITAGKSELNINYDFVYADQESSTNFDSINIFNPLVLFGFPMSKDTFNMIANLRVFNEHGEIKFSSACLSNVSRNIFKNTNMTELRKKCIDKMRENLQIQLNQSYEKGDFNVFKK